VQLRSSFFWVFAPHLWVFVGRCFETIVALSSGTEILNFFVNVPDIL
jgi:hypothetical protein